MTIKLITTQRDVLRLLADDDLRLSVIDGKAAIVRRDDARNLPIVRVQNGLATKLRDNDLLAYNGSYELTEKGKERCLKLKTEQKG